MTTTEPARPQPLTFSAESVPEELRARDHWVAWRYRFDADRGEWTKIPIDTATGAFASSTDPTTWASFDDAVAYAERDGADVDGVGFVVSDDDFIVGVDLDDCRDPETGDCDQWAIDLVDTVPTYAEVSPSGTGLRLFGLGVVPAGGTRADIDDAEGHLEMYETARYLTVTGHRVDDTPSDVCHVRGELAEVHAAHIAADTPTKDSRPASQSERLPVDSTEEGVPAMAMDSDPDSLSDEELLQHAATAENGEKFRRLWEGDTSGYPSHSEADLALVNLLGFWSGGDRRQIDRLFRQSALYREKWDRADYRDRTLDTALAGRTDFYESSPDRERAGAPDRHPGSESASGGMDLALNPTAVAAWAGLPADMDVSDLNDRQKAAAVWELLQQTDEFHVLVLRDAGTLWAYDDGIWKREGKRALRHAARQALGPMNYGKNVLAELKAQALSDPRVEITADDLGLSPGHLALENGLVSLEAAADGAGDDALRDLRPDDYALTRLPVTYDPAAPYDEWARYVDEWAEADRADALQEYVGYCLHVGAMPIHRALLLVGSGANGKGTFLTVIRTLFGRENTTSIELQTLANEENAVADFYGALANIDDDLSARKLGQGMGMFKKLVAGDRVRGRHLYEDAFEFDATGKHLYAANRVPDVNVPDDDEAFWRRWLLVEFPNHYPPSERDPNLRDELTTADALSGVLNWAIAGWKRLLDQEHFTGEEHYAQAKRERWQAWGESVDEFISKCVEHDPDADRLSTPDAYRRYVAWCRENDLDTVGQQKFTNTLKVEDVGYKKSIKINGTVKRGYESLGFTDAVPRNSDTPECDESPDSRQDTLG